MTAPPGRVRVGPSIERKEGRMTVARRLRVALALLVATGALVFAPAAVAAEKTAKITQADCDAGRIKDKRGNTLRGERCERYIGQRARLAETGFEAWWLLAGGIGCIGAAAALRVRRRPAPQLG
jgi:hypothetical protein